MPNDSPISGTWNSSITGPWTIEAGVTNTVTYASAVFGAGGGQAAILQGPGTLESSGNASVNAYNNATTQLELAAGLVWENSGVITQTGGVQFGAGAGDSATFVNESGAVYYLNGANAQVTTGGAGTYDFVNDGLLEMNAGGSDGFAVPLDNSGTVESTNGNFYLSGPVTNSGTLLANGGFLEVQGGTLGGTIEAISNNLGLIGTYSVAAGTTDTVTFESAYLGWAADGEAVFSGPGTLVTNGFVYVYQYNAAQTRLQLTNGITWDNAGFVQQEGGVEFGASATDSATIVNQSGATYLLNGGNAQITAFAGGTYNFVNDGLLKMNAGGNVTVAVPLNNSGTVASTNGGLYLSGPVTNSGTLIANGGFLEDQGGTLGGTIEAISNNVGLIGTYGIGAGTTDTVTFENVYLGWAADGAAVFAGPGTLVSNGFVYVYQYNGAQTRLQLTDGVTWDNAGTVQQQGGVEFGGSTIDTATIINQAGATYLLNGGNAQISNAGGGTYDFINDGLLLMNGGGADTVSVPLDNSGTVVSTNGNLYLSGPVDNSGTLIANGGFLEDRGGTLGGTIEALSNSVGLIGTYAVAADTTDTVTFGNANLGWISDGAAVFAGPGTLTSNGHVTVTQFNGAQVQLQLIDGITWDNAGAVTQNGGLVFGGSTIDTATLVNQAGATYVLNGGNAQISDTAGGTYNFFNAGTLTMVSGGGDTISVPLTNSGVVTSTNGQLVIAGGFVNSGTMLANGGQLYLEGGTLGGTIGVGPGGNNAYLTGTYAVASGVTDTVALEGATFGAGGGAAIAYVTGAGTLATNGSASINAYYYSYPELVLENGVTWTNFGAINQVGGLQFGNAPGDMATVINEAGATWTMNGSNADIEQFDTTGTYNFINNGLLQQVGGGGESIVVPLDNTGVVSSANGAIYIDGPLTNSGTIQTAGGQVQINGGTLGGTLNAANGAIYVMGTYALAANTTDTVVLGSVTFGNGGGASIAYLSGSGTLVTDGSASITAYYYSYPDLVLENGATWDNFASITQNGGLQLGGGTTGDTATVINEAGATWTLNGGNAYIEAGDTAGTYSFVNDGVLRMVGGGGIHIAVPLDNTGVISSTNGQIAIDGPLTNSGTIVTAGGSVQIDGGTLGGTLDAASGGIVLLGTYTVPSGVTDSASLIGVTFGSGGNLAYLSGPGTLATDGSTVINAYYYSSPDLVLMNGITWDDSGSLILNGGLQFGNQSGDSATLDMEAGSYLDMNGGNSAIEAPDSGTYTFIESGSLETTSGGSESISVVVDETSSGTISADNGNLYFYDGATISGQVDGGAEVVFDGGNVTVTATGDITTNTVDIAAGDVYMQGGTINSPHLTVGGGVQIIGYGAIGDAGLGGALIDASGGLLAVNGPVSGVASYQIETGATLALNGSNSGTVKFDGTDATLTLNPESGFSGSINNFAGGDTIDLPGITLSAVSYVGGDLIGTLAAGGTISLSAPGVDPGLQLGLGTDSSGASTIYLQPSPVSAVPDLLTALGPDNSLVLSDSHVYMPIIADPVLAIENAATAPADGLNVSPVQTTGSAYAQGQIISLAPGATDNSSIDVGLNDLTAGAESGTVGLDYASDGSVSGVETDLGTQTLNLSGNVYRLADPSLSAPANVYLHTGDDGGTATEALTIANTDPADGYSEGLDAAATGSVIGNLLSDSGTTADIAAGGSDDTSVTVSFSTATAGIVNGYAEVELISDGAGVDSLGTTPLNTGYVPVSATIDNYATAAIQQVGGAGTLTAIGGNTYTLNFGIVAAAPGAISEALDVANIASGQADWLSGSITATGDSAFNDTGLGSLGAISAGGSTPLSIDLSTANAGTFSQTITLAASSTNPGGSDPLPAETIVVTGTVLSTAVLAQPVINEPSPIVLPDAHVASLVPNDQIMLDIGNTGSDTLSGYVSSATGAAYGSGTITALAPGLTDTTDIIAGLNNTQAGSLTGTVGLSFTSGTNEVPLSPQTVSLEGNVYRLAAPSITGPVNAIVHVGDGVSDTDSEALVVGNTATADGFSENLDATALSVVSGNLTDASGTAPEVAPGAADTTSATFSFSTATAGVVSGTVAVSEVSDGSGVDTLGTTMLGTVDVPVSVTVDNYATAALQQTGGAGELVQTGSVYTLNLGDLAQGTGDQLAGLNIANIASGPADWLTGSLISSGNPAIAVYNGSASDALTATYFEVSTAGNGPDFGGGGTPNVANGSTLGPDGLPVVTAPAGISDVDGSTGEITWWDPSLNSGVVETGTGVVSLPYNSNMFAPNSTGPNDSTYYETAILQGTFSLDAPQSVTFQVGSDDDTFIYVDGTLIGQNPGVHGTETQNFTATDLSAGTHSVEIFYDDRDGGGANLNVNVLTPGVTLVPLTPGTLEAIGTLNAGATTPLAVELDTTNAGTFTTTITLAATDGNAAGYSQAMAGETLVVTGTVLPTASLANPVVNNGSAIALPDVHVASPANDQTYLDISNTGSDALSGYVAGTSGAAYASGSFQQLPPGDSDTSDILVGLNNTSDGVKTGSVALDFSSGGGTLISDGSFEDSAKFAGDGNDSMVVAQGSTVIPGWTVTAGNPLTWDGPGGAFGVTAEDGRFYLDLTGYADSPPYSAVTQTIATTAGDQYQLSFELGSSSNYGLPASLIATAGGTSQTFTSTGTGTDNWQRETLDFTAAGPTTVITLAGNGSRSYIGVDNVSVTPVGAPNAATLDPQTVAVSGTVYNYGTASISLPGTVYLHVGDDGGSATEALNVANTASTDGYSEGIDVAGAAGVGGVASTSGSSGDIAAGQTADAALTVSISTATAANGVTAAVTEASDGSSVDTLGTTNLGTVDVPLNVIVDNYATAEVLKTGGDGTVVSTDSPNVTTFDLGSTYQYADPLYVTGEILNAAAGPAADQLSGTFTASGDPEFANSGLGSFSGLNFGNADTSPEVTLNTGTIGTFDETIVVYGTGTNPSGYSGTLTAETIDVVGTILPVPPPPPPPLATAVAWGDVHLTTFDGLYYNFQAAGEFILAQSTVAGDTFAVQARMAPYSANSTVSVMTMIGANVGGQQVTFGLGRDDVVAVGGTGISLVNGQSYALAGGGSVTQLTSTSFQLNWGTGEVMDVTDAGNYFNLNLTLSAADGPGSIQGLLGSDTGLANDFQLADGTVLAQPLTSADLYGAFADAWRVTSGPGGNSLMDYLAGQGTATFTDTNFPADAVNIDNLPAAILQQAELEVQQAGITDPNQQAAAVLDLLVTGNPNALQDDVNVGQNGQTTTAAEISVPPPPVPALGVSAVATNVVETAGGTTAVTFDAYLTNASGTDTVIDWAVTSPNATYLTAGSLGSNPTSGFVVIPAGQTTGQFTITLPTGVLGSDPSDNLQVSISSTNGDPVFGQTAQTEIDNYQPQAGNPAVPVLTLAAGSGTFSGSDGNYTLNLGTLVAGEAPLQDRFQIANDALAPSDMLAGSITANGANFTVYGATQLSPLGAGTSYQGLVTEANTSVTGVQTETIVLNPVDENITGYSSIQAMQTVTITDTVLPDAVGDLVTGGPINLGTFYEGDFSQTALDIENAAGGGAAALDVTASSSGQATASGEINQLAPGASDLSSIEAGIDTSSPGVKTGYVTLSYTSDAGDGNTSGASSQQIEVIGTVFGPATASLSAPIVYVHKGDHGGSVTVPITISNTGTNDGFTEKLNAQIVNFGTYVTAASGSVTDLTPGFSNSTSLSATLSDANYGTYAGEVAVALQSDGSGIDSHGTTSLGMAYVQAAIDVDQFAVAALQEVSGNGTMTPTGVASHYNLDLGTVAQYATPLGANIAALNDVLGQSDLLAGGFSTSGAPEFTNAGLGPFGPGSETAGLAAGQEDANPVIVLSSATVGVFTETLTFNPIDYNPSGYSSALAPETVTITGTVVAAPPPTPAAHVSNAWGDVHLTTFDGLYYNFQAQGEFVLAQSTVAGDTFDIQARMQPYNGSSSVSVNTMVAAQVGSDRVTFGVDRTDTVWIDGKGVSLSGSPVVTLADGTLEQTSADAYRLVWNTGEELDITDNGSYLNATVSLPNSDAGHVQGLLGNDGGNPADDLTLPNGTPIETGGSISYAELYGTYAASWEVSDSTSLMDYQTGQNAASFFNPNFPYNQILLGNLPANAYQQALAAAEAAGITDPNLLQAAIVDYLFTGNPQALAASENVQQQEGGSVTAGQTVIAAPPPTADVGVLANEPTVVELTGTADAIGFTAYLTSPEATDTLIDYSVNGNGGPGYLNASDFPGDILPSGTVTIAAGQTVAEFTVAIPASVLGSEPDANLQVVITPQNPAQSVFAPEAQTEILNTGPTAGHPATPLVELLSGDGALTGSGTFYELDLGSVEQYSNPLLAGYGVENNGVVPADLLSGSFLDAGSSQFLNSGLSPFAPIATGNADTAPEVELLTNQVGTFTESVTLTPTDSNLTNYSSIMPLVTIEVVGTIVAPPPPPPPPGPEATAWGDVHLTTFDGLYYNFQAAGEYVLTRSTVAGDTFQVQSRLQPWGGGNSSVTVQTQVGAAIGSDDVVFALTSANYNSSPLYLNGTAEALGLGQTLTLAGGSVTETAPNTYRVNWATGESMTVTENGSYISDTIQLTGADAGHLQGLLGPDDGNRSTDLQLPNGQSIASNGTIASSTLYGQYASDWQVPSTANSLMYYTAGQQPSTFLIPGFPEDALALSQLPANLVAAAEAIVEAEGITDPNLIDAAVIDLLVTGDPNSVFSSANVQEEGVLLNSAAVSIPTPLPSVGIMAEATTALAPATGTLAVDYTVYLTAASAQTSTIDYSVIGSGPDNLGTAGIVGGTGSGIVQIAAGQTSAQIVVDVLASALGSLPDAELVVGVTATGGESLFGGTAETEIVNPTPTAGNPAAALIEQLSGNGHLSGSGTDYVLNLGTQIQNGSDLYANLGIENRATVPADGLSGQFTITNFANFLNTGFTPFSSVAPGAADTEPAISLGTGTIGVYTETVVLKPTDTNATGYSQPQNDVTLTVTGTIVPMPLPPPPSMPTATAWGDVHLTTFDGLYYNFQAVGEFTLAKSTVPGNNFDVQIRTTQYGGSSVSVMDQVAAGFGDNQHVTFGTSASQPATVLLNGGAANFVNGVLTLADGSTVTEESPTSYVVNWTTGESMTVNVAGSYVNTTVALATQDQNGHVEGLLGYDSGVNNDFAPIVSGTTITTNQLYYGSGIAGDADSLADYWRVAQANSLLYYANGTNTNNFTNIGFPADAFSLSDLPTALQLEGLQEAVQAGITDPQLQQAAALDFIVTGDPQIVTGGANVQQQGITTTNSDVTGAALTPALGVSANNAALVEPASGNLGVGFTVYLTQAEAQATTVDWGVDAPGSNFLNASDFAGDILPSGSVVIAAGSTSASFSVEVNAGVLADLPSNDLQVTIAATGTEAVFAPSAQTTIVNNQVEPGTPAIPEIALLSGEGSLTHVGNAYTLDLGAVTLGGSLESLSLAIENAATAGSNSLAGSLAATTIPGFTVSGTGPLPVIAAGDSYQGLHVAVNTSAAGVNSETITFTPVEQNASGYWLDDAPLTLTIEDTISGAYASASPVTPNPVNFGVVHVGTVLTQALTVTNSAPSGAEDLDGSIGSTTGAATDNGGSFTGLAPTFSNSSSLVIGLSTATSGVESGSAIVSLESDGSGIDANGITPLTSQTIDVFGTVDNYATAAIAELSGGGILTHSGNAYTLNVGTLTSGSSPVIINFGVSNIATGLADLLGGTLSIVNGSGAFINNGDAAFSGLGAGQGDLAPAVTLTAGANGAFTETITLNSYGTNASGYHGTLTPETLTIKGSVTSVIVLAPSNEVVNGANNVTIEASGGVLRASQQINGGGGTNTLDLIGGGIFNLAAPAVLENIQVVNATEGTGTAEPIVFLRNGLDLTLNLLDPVGAAVVHGAINNDIINLGTGDDTVYVGSGETIIGGTGLDLYYVTSATTGETIAGNSGGTNDLFVYGGGTVVMGDSITNMNNVFLVNAGTSYDFTANDTPGLIIHGGPDSDTITVGDGSQRVLGTTGNLLVKATAANAGVAIRSGTGSNTLEITTGGLVALNSGLANITVELDAASTLTLPISPSVTIDGIAGNDVFVVTNGVLRGGQNITGGGSSNTLVAQGGGVFSLNAPTTLSNIQVVDATEGAGAAKPSIFLRDGLDLTLNLGSAATNPQSAGAVVRGATNNDIVNLGAGVDTVYVGSGETVNGGTGVDAYYITSATTGETIAGNSSGTNDLYVQGGGSVAMGGGITNMDAVFLANAGVAYNFTANATPGLVIHASTDSDTITVGDLSQRVLGSTGNLLVQATAANAGVAIRSGTGSNTLEITTGGVVALNSGLANITVELAAADTLTLPISPSITIDGAGSDVFVATNGVLRGGQNISGGGSNNTLVAQGGGIFSLNAPTTLSNIQVVDATEGTGTAAEPIVFLRNGLDLTLNLEPAATTPQSAAAVVHGATNADIINLGSGTDTVYVGNGETVNGGTGRDLYYITSATTGETLAGNSSGTNDLYVQGGGTVSMGGSITNMNAVFLVNAGTSYNFTANATNGLVIHASGDSDTITVGGANQTVIGSTGNLDVLATASEAGVAIRSGTGGAASNELDITTSGTTTLNSADNNLTVQLDAANTTLTLDHMQFIHAEGTGGNDLIIAGAAGQTLTGGGTGDTLEDLHHYGVTFLDTAANFDNDTLANFTSLDTIDITNLTGVSSAPIYTGNSSSGTLAVIGSTGTVDIHMTNFTTGGAFSAGTDGHGGTLITYS